MKKHLTFLPILALCTVLAGCSALSPIAMAPTKTYTLSKLVVAPSPNQQTNQTITVMPVTATRGFDSSAMIYENQPYLLTSFAQNAWIAPPANMLTTLMTAALQQSQSFKAVVMGPSISTSTYLAKITLLGLYQDFMINPSEVVLTLDTTLINGQTNVIIADKTFTTRVKTTANTPYGGVIAANDAVNILLNQITQFLIEQVTQNQAQS